MNDQPTVLGDRYELGPVIGRGGMAHVRRARDRRLGRAVAVKQLRVDLASDSTFQARFRREAQAAAGLNHPNIVSVYDTGEQVDEATGIAVPFIVMELVDGRTLRDILREGRPILPERALEFTQGILDALAYSHRAGIIHRDIKPANVMLTNSGMIKVMDFGIARAVSDTSSTMTQTAAVIGTAQYLSPEQARGETVDVRSDLYSAGCLLYELLVGRPPFTGDSPVSVAYQHVREAPVPPSELDAEVTPQMDAVVLKSLAKDPDDRYQSADEMRQDIGRILTDQPVLAHAPGEGATQVIPVPVPATASAAAGRTSVYPAATDPLPRSGATPSYHAAPHERRRRTWVWPLLTLVLLALAALAALYLLPLSQAQTVTVPIVTGQKQAIAEQIVRDSSLRPVVTSTRGPDDDTVGEVVGQEPAGNASAPEGSNVTLTVNSGPNKVVVPAGMIGRDVDEAMAFAKQNGFPNVKKVAASAEPTDAQENQVLSVSPREGSSVAAGTELTFTYATGTGTVPNVATFTLDQAKEAITAAGFSNVVVEQQERSGVEPNRVLGTRPAAGTKQSKGERVIIEVAIAPKATPSATSTGSSPSSAAPTSPAPSAAPSPSPSSGG